MDAPDHHPCRRGQGRHDLQAFERGHYFTGMDTTPHTDGRSPSAQTSSPDRWSLAYVHRTAAARVFVVTELIHLLTPGVTPLTVTRARPTSPPRSGSLYLYDLKLIKRYKDDGHDWVRKRPHSSNRVREDRAKLRLPGGKFRVAGFYARSATVSTMRRRSYYLLNTKDDSVDACVKNQRPAGNLVLVHYLDAACTASGRDDMQRKRGSVTTTPLVMSGSPATMRGRSPPEAGVLDSAGEGPRRFRRRISTPTWSDGRGSAGGASSSVEGSDTAPSAKVKTVHETTAAARNPLAFHRDAENRHRDLGEVNVVAKDNDAFADHLGILHMGRVHTGNGGEKVADSSCAARHFLLDASSQPSSSRQGQGPPGHPSIDVGICRPSYRFGGLYDGFRDVEIEGYTDASLHGSSRSQCASLYDSADGGLWHTFGEGLPGLDQGFATGCASSTNSFTPPLSCRLPPSSSSPGSLKMSLGLLRMKLMREYIDKRNLTLSKSCFSLLVKRSRWLPPASLLASHHRMQRSQGTTPIGEDGDGDRAIDHLAFLKTRQQDTTDHACSPSSVAATAPLVASRLSKLLGQPRLPPTREIIVSEVEETTPLSSLSNEDLVRVWDSFSDADRQRAIDDVLGKDSVAASTLLNRDACVV